MKKVFLKLLLVTMITTIIMGFFTINISNCKSSSVSSVSNFKSYNTSKNANMDAQNQFQNQFRSQSQNKSQDQSQDLSNSIDNEISVKISDVGSFEDYDSGSSWGGSSWDSGSSWGSSSWDSGSSWRSSSWDSDDSWSSSGSYGSSSSGNLSISDIAGLVYLITEHPILTLIIIAIIIISVKRKGKLENRNLNAYRPSPNYTMTEWQTQIEKQIQANDPNFNKEELIAWSKNLFVKLQQAWTARDWETIRTFETESLFEQHKNQLQGYINNRQINVMDRICVNYAHLFNYRQEGDKEILTVRLNSRMQDYIIDEDTKNVIKGDKNIERVNTYLLTFIRKNGVKTKAGTIEVNTTNCPNCGAPTKITSSGKCEYCGSVITTGEYNWVLSNLERER